jgi:hypothetical protein
MLYSEEKRLTGDAAQALHSDGEVHQLLPIVLYPRQERRDRRARYGIARPR